MRTGVEARDRKIVSFILDSGMPGLEQSAAFKKMGIGSSPTGELFLSDVKAGPERLMGESEDGYGRSGAKSTFSVERSGVAAMALGLVERCAGAVPGLRENPRAVRPADWQLPTHPVETGERWRWRA